MISSDKRWHTRLEALVDGYTAQAMGYRSGCDSNIVKTSLFSTMYRFFQFDTICFSVTYV